MNDLGNEYDEDHSRQHGEIKYIQALLRIIVILMFGLEWKALRRALVASHWNGFSITNRDVPR